MRTRIRVAITVMALAAGTGFAVATPGAIATALPTSSASERAGKFMAAIAREKLARQFDVAWASLYTPHQEVATREAYVACESRISWSGSVAAVRIVRVFPEQIWIAGATRKLATTAVSMRITVVATATPIPVVIAQTFHAIRVGGGWRWILKPGAIRVLQRWYLPLCVIRPAEGAA
jgi:hypothetical protein